MTAVNKVSSGPGGRTGLKGGPKSTYYSQVGQIWPNTESIVGIILNKLRETEKGKGKK